MEASKSTGLLRDSVREKLALAAQRQSRIDLIARSDPITVTCLGCGRPVAASRFGRKRSTCSGTCRTRLWRQRKAERERARTLAGEQNDDPVAAGWDPVRKRWRSREAFETWWPGRNDGST